MPGNARNNQYRRRQRRNNFGPNQQAVKTGMQVANRVRIMPNPGQSTKIKISVIPDQNNMQTLCAAFVLYGLTLGYDKAKAKDAYMGLLILLRNAMANGSEILTKAPRLWWAVQNICRPKNIKYKGQEFGFEFDVSNLILPTDLTFSGCILGSVTHSVFAGLYTIDNSPSTVTTLEDASDAASDLFAFYPQAHKSIVKVDDFIHDCSAFAWKGALLPDQNPSDQAKSAYSVCFLEVPITSYFGYMGLATGSFNKGVPRIPKHAVFCQGQAGNHIGLRLHFPSFRTAKHVMTQLNFKPVDLQSWINNDTSLRTAVYENLVNAGRTSGPGPLPDGYVQVSNNLALLYRMLNFTASMLSVSAMWFGCSQTFAAIAVGTNNLDPFATTSLTESYVSIASSRQLQPIMKPNEDVVTVPFPVITEDAVAEFYTFFGLIYPNTDTDIAYGTTQLDFLNSAVGSTIVSWIDGPILRDEKQKVKGADARYQNQLPTSSPLSVFSPAATRNTLSSKSLVLDGDSLDKMGLSLKEAYCRVLKLRVPKKALDAAYEDIMSAKRERKLMWANAIKKGLAPVAASRTSPSTLPAQQIAIVSEVPIDITHAIETMMQMPVSAYLPASQGVEIERLINGGVAAYETGNLTPQSFTGDQISTANSFVKDPTSMQGSEAAEELISLSKGIARGVMDTLDTLGPVSRGISGVIKAAIPLAKQAIGAVKKRRANKKAKKAQAKQNK